MRCNICGRLPAEACCDTCHRVHHALQRQILSGSLQDPRRRAAQLALDQLDRPTEAVNQ